MRFSYFCNYNITYFLDNSYFLSYIKNMNFKSGLKNLLNPFSLLYLFGFLFVSIELFFKLSGKSLCQTEGCRIVESFVKGGEFVLLLSGVALFGFLFILSLKRKAEYFHSIILLIALSIEGYLLGFQSFIIQEFCLFCLIVFSILFISAILRLIKGRKEIALALISFVSVFFITFVVNSQINEFPSSQYVLIYSKNCPVCKEIIQYCKQMSISVETIEAKKVSSILKTLNINSVPVLLYNEGHEKRFIIGAKNIKEYLLEKVTPKQEGGEFCPIFTPAECK